MAKPILTIAAEWASFEQMLLRGASRIQKQEMRRAFYAGAATFMHLVMTGLDPGSEPTSADEAQIDALASELERFKEDLIEGRA